MFSILLYFCEKKFFTTTPRKIFHERNQKVRVNLTTYLNLFFNFSQKYIVFPTIFHLIIKQNLSIGTSESCVFVSSAFLFIYFFDVLALLYVLQALGPSHKAILFTFYCKFVNGFMPLLF